MPSTIENDLESTTKRLSNQIISSNRKYAYYGECPNRLLLQSSNNHAINFVQSLLLSTAGPFTDHSKLTNDDGPPSAQVSPYILPFVEALEAAGHLVSVIIPDTQRSWIGKAHMLGQAVQTRPYWPPAETPATHDPTKPTAPADHTSRRPWILVNSTPASCSQLGLNGPFFKSSSSSSDSASSSLPPIDLVISGPNFGRNTTAVFALSSGTLGAALEATVCGARAIALSFAFFKDQPNWDDPAAIREACAHGVRVCEHLAKGATGPAGASEVRWTPGLLYSVNVPVQVGVSQRRVLWTKMLGNQWLHGGCFEEVPAAAAVAAVGAAAAKTTANGDQAAATATAADEAEHGGVQHFKWAPRFQDVYQSVLRAGPGSDGWAVKEGETSVTALMANFMPAEGFAGEVKL